MSKGKEYNLQDRMIGYAVQIIWIFKLKGAGR